MYIKMLKLFFSSFLTFVLTTYVYIYTCHTMNVNIMGENTKEPIINIENSNDGGNDQDDDVQLLVLEKSMKRKKKKVSRSSLQAPCYMS